MARWRTEYEVTPRPSKVRTALSSSAQTRDALPHASHVLMPAACKKAMRPREFSVRARRRHCRRPLHMQISLGLAMEMIE
jgi:hypothetical protein